MQARGDSGMGIKAVNNFNKRGKEDEEERASEPPFAAPLRSFCAIVFDSPPWTQCRVMAYSALNRANTWQLYSMKKKKKN